ncbi:dynamin [Paenibacillus glacialis]|uniref:Dynamin n=2 Tax=Paenibacillus glacialis TaxID=494026 RepID=A0A162K800_9BACL|nr:dynamin [Paenibacillus glacialis]
MMVATASNKKNELAFLEALKSQLSTWGDAKATDTIDDLIHKEQSGELTIAWCGHFSAGKSSLINALCGMKVLPSGPVPTSANVVTIRNGSARALIYSQDDVKVPMEVTTDELNEYCTNGGSYSSVEVWEQIPFLGSDGVLMDTPGVDSTDDGHKKATHSALHLADVVLYVMDYNHVQSENNLVFAKSLSDWGKPLYLIVNQIDKHREQELSFQSYRDEVITAFERWQVQYVGLMFSSLKEADHPYNQYDSLKELITGLIGKKKELVRYSVSCSANHVADDHILQFGASLAEEKERLLEQLGGLEQLARMEDEKLSLVQEQDQLRGLIQYERATLRKDINAILDNANLMPAEIRELAYDFVESRKPGFKKGLWLAGNKTRVEQEQRQDIFLQKLQEQVSSQVEWHVRQLVATWADKHHLWSDEWQREMDLFIPSIDEEVIYKTVQTDAVLSGEYVLNYCRSVAEQIKVQYRRSITEFTEQLLLLLEEGAARELQRLSFAMADLEQQSAQGSRYAALEREEVARAQALAELLPPRVSLTPGLLPAVRPLGPPAPAVAAEAGALAPAQVLAPPHSGSGAHLRGGAASGRRQRLADAAAQLHGAAALLAKYPAMASAARGIRERAAALEGGTFTLALFGAFSAGKSSFANALLGEDVLPVSPHPTTAAINRILAPHDDFKHGTAQVVMKSRETLMEDLRISFSILHLGEPDLNHWSDAVHELTSEGIHPAGLPHYGFLKAACAGWVEAEGILGTMQTVDLTQYRSFVADETKSCFVERIDLFYSCELTEQGIILVDTPGADSLHARHTGVTFQYMKHADALVFVTYYNHAFSKGDRQFLSQLGRVKDSFALDKMFFIINAADLAGSSDELEQVIQHVKSNLRSSGIASPHIYALSSMNALEGKIADNESLLLSSGFTTFESSLHDFAGKELPGLSIQAARQEITSARKRAEEWDRISQQDEATRGIRQLELQKIYAKAKEMLTEFTHVSGQDRVIEQETKELLFHVRKRIDYNLAAFFNEAFHPSLLRDGTGSLKEIFSDCGRELEQSLLRELDQELWATTLRLEIKAKSILQEASQRFTDHINALDEGLLLSPVKEEQDWMVPDLQGSKFHKTVEWSGLWSTFKSPKLFFEGKGREKLKGSVEPLLKDNIAEAAIAQEPLLCDFYIHEFSVALTRQAYLLSEQLLESQSALESTLQLTEGPVTWLALAEQLKAYE